MLTSANAFLHLKQQVGPNLGKSLRGLTTLAHSNRLLKEIVKATVFCKIFVKFRN